MPSKPLKECSVERVRELLSYNPATGIFRWRVDRTGVAKIGEIAGSRKSVKKPYRRIKIDGVLYASHRLAWVMMMGEWPERIGRKNPKHDDNRWSNLRLVTEIQSSGNRKLNSNNTSGHKGVSFCKTSKKWMASIGIDGKMKALGRFETVEEAIAAYREAAEERWGEFARPI